MAELLDAVTSWKPPVLVFVVFGFAPGFCLRLIVLAYPRGDVRRAELIAELRAVPRIERPLWVAEQLEVAVFEGLPHRVSEIIRQRRARAESQADLKSRLEALESLRSSRRPEVMTPWPENQADSGEEGAADQGVFEHLQTPPRRRQGPNSLVIHDRGPFPRGYIRR